MLSFIAPMLPTLVDEPPEGDGWIHEIKFDGYRTQLVLQNGGTRAFTRRGHDWTERYEPIIEAAAALRVQAAILDGEMIVQDPTGRSDFRAFRGVIERQPERLLFMAFDLLHQDGRDLRALPVEERRSRLGDLLAKVDASSRIQFSSCVQGGGGEFFAAADRMGLEGIVSKRLGSRYRSGYGKAWLKTKTFGVSELVVVGVERGDRAPVALLAWEADGNLTYAGGAMVTLPSEDRDRFWERIEDLRVRRAPLPVDKKLSEGSWVQPVMRLRVKHLRGEEMLRHATVEAIATLGEPSAKPAPRASSREATFPKPDVHHRDVAAYYESMADVMLPWLANRPLNLFRCLKGRCYFQRNENHPPSGGVIVEPVHAVPVLQKNGKTERYFYVDSAEGVLAAARADTFEFHAWGSRVDDIERPDRIALDLDPGEGVGFEAVKNGAMQLRASLDAIGLDSWPLLTGGKGIHVVIPFHPEGDWDDVRAFAHMVCAALADAAPDRFTVALPKAERRGRIFLDYLRNQRTATAIMPYSARAREGAGVAAPVIWRELAEIDRADHFTIRDAALLMRRSSKKLRGWGVSSQRLPAFK
ncbi:MAG TPA: non-homologous end-joining DNA ligase [Allosphingosinicella sp.]|nr:non-homologous end-joining DNA ligase [Allosphingosinicella sp.]